MNELAPDPRMREGLAPFRRYQTWYRVVGDLRSGVPPLFLVHGGPGCTHDYLEELAALASGGRAVVFYDQIGNGRATHLREAPRDFWTVDLFKDELCSLIAHLGAGEAHSVLGQSWGGMLAAEYAVDRPAGLRTLVLSNPPASMPVWSAESIRLRKLLPPEIVATMERHEAAGTFDDPEYESAAELFASRFICRVPASAGLMRTRAAMRDDATTRLAMNGPSDFPVSGNLRDWSIVNRLAAIDAPTLVISGKYDQATPAAVSPFAERIAGAQWQIFEESSHIPHVEEPARFIAAVEAFLNAHNA